MAAIPTATKFERDVIALRFDMKAFALGFEKQPSLADDLVQETMLKALLSRDSFVEGTNLRGWLFSILRNTFYTSYKRRAREPVGLSYCVSVGSEYVGPDQEWSLRLREVAASVNRLPIWQREALLLVAAGIQYAEAAAICSCEIGTVKSRVHRARGRLAVELGESSSAGCAAAI